ncbi:MAG: cytochrome d ubiquinol oxidase subunit II [Halieaceae bacterium]|nr:cytochrome d ubiquinol oxidase subunit II [Halieaceae bacterium]
MASLGLAYSLFPYIVIDRLTIWEVAAATESLQIIFYGVAVTLPAIIGYTIFIYKIFHGKARELSYE